MAETILVIGATGHIGSPVAHRLVANGFTVRLLVRDLDRARSILGEAFEYVLGDVGDRAAVDRALDGCAGVHVSLGGASGAEALDRVEHRGTALVAERAAHQGVRRLTYLSGDYVGIPEGERLPAEQAKARAEAAIRSSGIPYTILRPTYFLETLPRHIQGRFAIVLGRQPHRLRMVAASDFGDMVSKAFRAPEAGGRVLAVRGPEAISIPDALRLYCSIVQPAARVVTVPLPVMSAVDRVLFGGKLRRTLDTMRLLQLLGERSDAATADSLLGRAVMTPREWCESRASRAAAAQNRS